MADRTYSAGTIAGLMSLCGGTCYWPGCSEPVIRFVDGAPKSNLQIAHICAVKPSGPRYDSNMSDSERNGFVNLILLCHPHHTTVDRDRPHDYSPEVLRQWKSTRETPTQAELRGLREVTEEGLQQLITAAFDAYGQRIDDALDRLKRFDSEAADLLKGIKKDLVERITAPRIDQDAVAMLYATTAQLANLNVPDSAISIDQAATRLRNALASIETLNAIVARIESLGAIAEHLDAAASNIRSAASALENSTGGF